MIDDKQVLDFFGKRLRMARHAAQLSQDDLAKRIGAGQDTISHYESGHCRPDLTTLARLAEALRVNPGYFFQADVFNTLNDEHRETLALLGSLSPFALYYVLTFVRQFTTGQQHYQFLAGEDFRERSLQMFLERDLHRLERDVLQQRLSSGDSPLQLLARFTVLLLMVIELETRDVVTDELVHRLAVSGQRLTLHMRSIINARETVAGA